MINRIIKVAFPALCLALISASCADRAPKSKANYPSKRFESEFLESNILNNPINADTVFLNKLTSEGEILWQQIINTKIEKLSSSGGGVIFFDKGTYDLEGPIRMQSGIELHLQKGAVIKFSSNPEDYLPLVKVRWEGTVCYNYSPLIYGIGLERIAITGDGIIDGNAIEWSKEWRKKQKPDKKRLRQMGNDTIPDEQRVFGNGFLDLDGDGEDDSYGDGEQHYLRPTLIEFYECENILIQGVTIKDSPFWTVHPVFSKNIVIRDLVVDGTTLNDDGVDPDSCEDVLIENCTIRTHDDAISIKAGRDQDAWNRPGSKNILIRNNRLESGVNAFCIGSEMSGGVSDVFVMNNQVSGGKHAVNFKCNLDRGGAVERIIIDSLEVENTSGAMVIFKMNYKGWRGNEYPTTFRDFTLTNISCDSVSGPAFEIVGVEQKPIENVTVRDVNVKYASETLKIERANNLEFEDVMVNGEILHLEANE